MRKSVIKAKKDAFKGEMETKLQSAISNGLSELSPEN
jgi:hypothetical protein